jgi:hypothetical protein
LPERQPHADEGETHVKGAPTYSTDSARRSHGKSQAPEWMICTQPRCEILSLASCSYSAIGAPRRSCQTELIRDIGVGNAALTRLGAGQCGFMAHARPGFADRPGLLGAGSCATPAGSGDVFKRSPAMKKIMSMALVRPYWRWVAHPVPKSRVGSGGARWSRRCPGRTCEHCASSGAAVGPNDR